MAVSSAEAPPPAGLQAPPALTAHAVHRFFRTSDQEVLALRDVSLEVSPGELVAVLGPSGSGKSTLIACLAGLDRPDAGTVEVAGHRITGLDERERSRFRARHVGVLLQTANLIEHLTVAQNVDLAQRLARRTPSIDVAVLLSRLGLARRARAHPSRLSGGEAARAGLAVALANDPPVLLADEPTGELDGTTEAQVLTLLEETRDRGAAVLVASHSPAVADAADRHITLADGALVS